MCDTCKAIEQYSAGTAEGVIISALPNATALIASKEHKRLAELPTATQQELLLVANQVSVLMYESMQAHGTNILCEDNEHAHYLVISRTENDGLPLKWEGKKSSPSEIQETAKKIADSTWTIGKKDVTEIKNPVVKEQTTEKLTTPEPEAVRIKDRELEDPSMRHPEDFSGKGLDDVAAEIQRKVSKGPTDEKDYRIRHLTRRR